MPTLILHTKHLQTHVFGEHVRSLSEALDHDAGGRASLDTPHDHRSLDGEVVDARLYRVDLHR